jgi:ferritin-like metal-binding protein YciE
MKLDSLENLYREQLRDLYSAEKQLTVALPKMAEGASSSNLRKAFEQHLRQTEQHVNRLEQIFQEINVKPGRKKCKGMEGLIKEGEEILKENGESAVVDAGLIAAAQRVEHYEIAGYGTVRTYAEQLGHNKAASILQKTLEEESSANEKLTQLAEGGINQRARQA